MVTGSRVLELFGRSTRKQRGVKWGQVIASQRCPFTDTRCFKVRKSQPDISIGTCSVRYGRQGKDIIICPNRLLERRQVFTDCLHLLSLHEPGNELHVVPEVSIPGGSVDYFLASVRAGKVRDFAAIEFQTLDTTGTVWPERQRLLVNLGIRGKEKGGKSSNGFGMNWKMTAKTILIQLHHKVETLEHIGKRFALVIQDHLLSYLQSKFNFGHLRDVRLGDTLHIHAYELQEKAQEFRVQLGKRISTDAAGVAACLGIQGETRIELETIIAELERKISARTVMALDTMPMPAHGEMPTE